MANIDSAYGLRPFNMLGSGANSQGVTNRDIQTTGTAGTSSKIWFGSPVIQLANGLIDIVGSANGGTVALLGVFAGCQYVALDGTPTWSQMWPGTSAVKSGTAAVAYVWDNPNQLFTINADAAITQASVNANANFATATSGNDTTMLSSAELAVSTVNTTDSLNLRIMGFNLTPSSQDTSSAGIDVIVKLNVHVYNQATGI